MSMFQDSIMYKNDQKKLYAIFIHKNLQRN